MAFLDDRKSELPLDGRLKLLVLTALAVLWVLAELERNLRLLPSDWAPVFGLIDMTPAFAPPLMLLLLGWILLDRLTGRAAGAAAGASARASSEELLDGVREANEAFGITLEKAASVRSELADHAHAMKTAATRLDRAGLAALEGSSAIGTALSSLEDRLPKLLKAADDAETALGEAIEGVDARLTATSEALQALRERSTAAAAEGVQATAEMKAALAQIDEVASHTTQLVANRAYALDGAVTGVLERSVVVLDTIRESLLAQGRSIEESVKQAREQLEACGTHAAAEIAERMQALIERGSQLDGLLGQQKEAAGALGEEFDSMLAALETRFAAIRTGAASELESLTTRLAEVSGSTEATIGRLDHAHASVSELQDLAAALPPAIDSFGNAVDGQLPRLEKSLASIGDLADRVQTQVEALTKSIEASASMLRQLSEARTAEEEKLDALVARFMAANIR